MVLRMRKGTLAPKEADITFPTTLASVQTEMRGLEEFGESYGTVTIVSGLGPECVLNGRVKVDDLNTESGIQKLNQVANVIDNMSDEELGLLGGALSIERAKNLDVVLRIIDSLDQYEIYPEIKTSEALGRLLAGPSSPIGPTFFPKQVLPYLDYEKIASEQAKTFGGGYTLYGYTRKKRKTLASPDERSQAVKNTRMFLDLECRGYCIALDLPTTLNEAAGTIFDLIAGFENEPVEINISGVSGPIPNLYPYIQHADLENEADIQKLNTLAERITHMTQDAGRHAGQLNRPV